ncbi:hypothetical protein [Streptomyces olivaceoviridis]
MEISVRDSDPALPVPRGADPHRVGKHNLEIVMAVCRSFGIRREPVASASKPPSCWPTIPAGTRQAG